MRRGQRRIRREQLGLVVVLVDDPRGDGADCAGRATGQRDAVRIDAEARGIGAHEADGRLQVAGGGVLRRAQHPVLLR